MVRLSRIVITTDSLEPVTARKKEIRGGHKFRLRKLISSINHLLQDTDSAENNAELLSRKLQLERKEQIIAKLDEEILEEIKDERKIAHETEPAKELHSLIAIFKIKLERVLGSVHYVCRRGANWFYKFFQKNFVVQETIDLNIS